jgi:SAM-dependent methyltransferase
VNFTGERVIPGEVDPDLLNEHLARYYFARRFSAGKVVLDAACGSGYGSAMLGENAKAVYGADISPEAIKYARRVYGSPNLYFSEADCLALPFPTARFDLVVAFEIIEHLKDPEALLGELDRVLSPSGLLLLSTPNRLYYTEERGETNPFHDHEFSFEELEEALRKRFPHRAILFENHVPGVLLADSSESADLSSPSSILTEKAPAVSSNESGKKGGERAGKTAHYFVAVCAHRPLDPLSPLLYLPSTGNVLRERETHIRRLTGYLAEAKADADRARTAMERAMAEAEEAKIDAARLRAQVEEMRAGYERQIQDLNGVLEERLRWAQDLDRQLTEKGSYISQLQSDIESKVQWALSLQQELEQARTALQKLQQEFDERTAWALRLDGELKERLGDLRTLYGSRWYRLGKNLRLSPVPPSDHP